MILFPGFPLFRLFVVLVFITALSYSCSNECPVVQNDKVLRSYADLSVEPNVHTKIDHEVAIYLDYSNGMHGAISQCYTFFQEVINILDRRNARFFKVGLGAPKLISEDIFEPHSRYNPRNPINYSDERSYLKIALTEICSKPNRQAVFITDFERVPDPNLLPDTQYYNGQAIRTNVDFSPWATKEFEDWLSQGGSIDIFAHPFEEINQKERRYLYFLVFTPKVLVGIEDPQGIFHRLHAAGYTDTQSSKLVEWLGFSHGRFKSLRTYEARDSGGLNALLAPNISSFGLDWDYYQINATDLPYIGAYSDEDSEADTTILGSLMVKGQKSSFVTPKIAVRVFSATTDYQSFSYAYHMDSLSLYKPSNLPKWDGIFSIVEQEEKLVKLILDSSFQGMETACELYKIDIWLESAQLEMDHPKMKRCLQWEDDRGGKTLLVSSLYESMREAMLRQTFKPRRIHTFFIELIN